MTQPANHQKALTEFLRDTLFFGGVFLKKNFVGVLVIAVILYLGFNLTMSGIGELLEASRSKSWPTVQGTVTDTLRLKN